MRETQVLSLGQGDPLEKEMATHTSILAWRIPRTEEAGGLQSVGSQSDTTEQPNNSNSLPNTLRRQRGKCRLLRFSPGFFPGMGWHI